jgi:hypothetical protein
VEADQYEALYEQIGIFATDADAQTYVDSLDQHLDCLASGFNRGLGNYTENYNRIRYGDAAVAAFDTPMYVRKP